MALTGVFSAAFVGLVAMSAPALPDEASASARSALDVLRGTTVNPLLDIYYGHNFNDPIGRVNLLRAYDVSSSSFSLNQAALVLENAPDPDHGKPYGLRLDLQWGQATQTLQGNPVNEPRPELYRAIFQAYGTYVIPLGRGVTVDLGKWASALGIEGNYTKDQMNYSRSFWYTFLPFYHVGLRVHYDLSDAFGVSYWLTNGTQQTESFKNFMDQLFGVVVRPSEAVTWNVNYYLGQEHPDVVYFPNAASAPPGLPTQQGVPFQPIQPASDGLLHIFDSYLSWKLSPVLTVAIEADYVLSAGQRAWGGAAYARWQLTEAAAVAGRAEYLADAGALFSGTSQDLKETTVTAEYRLADGLLLRGEWRRDFSNRAFFFTSTQGTLAKAQQTLTAGAVVWFGAKEGSW